MTYNVDENPEAISVQENLDFQLRNVDLVDLFYPIEARE